MKMSFIFMIKKLITIAVYCGIEVDLGYKSNVKIFTKKVLVRPKPVVQVDLEMYSKLGVSSQCISCLKRRMI